MTSRSLLLGSVLTCLLFTVPLSAQIGFDPVYPRSAFDEAAAKRQLEPGTSSIHGTVTAKEEKALIKSFNLSKTRYAYAGTVVTLLPESAYLAEWRALLQQTQKRSAKLQRASLSPTAYSYRVVTKVTDDQGNFEFRNLKPGKYYLYAEVSFVKAGTRVEQTGSVNTVHVGSGQVLASTPIYTGHAVAVDVTKASSALIEIAQDGQTVVASLTGQ